MTRATRISPLAPQKSGPFTRRKHGNAMAMALNAVLALRGGRGVRVVRSEAGFLVEFDPSTADLPVTPPGSGDGSLNWAGVWDTDCAYYAGDLAIVPPSEMEDATSGTFVCTKSYDPAALPAGITLADVSPPTGDKQVGNIDPAKVFWERLAAGNWARMIVRDPETPANGRLDALGGRMLIELDNETPPTAIDLGRNHAVPDAIKGLTLRLMALHGCDLETGDPISIAIIGALIPPPTP